MTAGVAAKCIAVVDVGGDDWTAGGHVARMMARSISGAASSDRSVLFVSRRVQPADTALTQLGIEVVDLGSSKVAQPQGFRGLGSSRSPVDRKLRRALSLPDAADPLAYLRGRNPDAVLPLMSAPLRPRLAGSVGWIADFQHRAMPEFFSAHERSVRDRTYANVASRCRVVVVSSNAMAKQFREIYPMYSSKLKVLPFPSRSRSQLWTTTPRQWLGSTTCRRRFVLVANQFWQHKNHGLVVDAIAQAASAGVAIPVVMTGLPADNRDPTNRYVSDLLAANRQGWFERAGHRARPSALRPSCRADALRGRGSSTVALRGLEYVCRGCKSAWGHRCCVPIFRCTASRPPSSAPLL